MVITMMMLVLVPFPLLSCWKMTINMRIMMMKTMAINNDEEEGDINYNIQSIPQQHHP
jgi:hypothetical protein